MAKGCAFLTGGGEMGTLMRAHHWSSTSLGVPEAWPKALKVMVSACLNSPMLGTVLWGPDLLMLYNDAYIPSLIDRHPDALGRPVAEVWGETWDLVAAPFHRAMATGEGFAQFDVELPMVRRGKLETTYWNFTATPIRGKGGRIVGLLNQGMEATEQNRTAAALRELNVDLERKITDRALARGHTWQVSPDILGVLKADGYFEASNPAWAAVLGWTEEEVARTAFFDFIHPDDQAATQAAWTAAIELGSPALRFENRYRHKDGTWRWLSWVAVPDDGKVYCSARDITTVKAGAEELASRTAERDRMWETSPDLMLVIDFEGVFQRVNPAWTTVLGYTGGELVGHHVNEFVIPDDHDQTTNAYEKAAAGGLPRVINRYRHKNGSVRWISWVAAPAGTMTYATGRDITADREREAALSDMQDFTRLALSSVGGVGVWTYDAASDRFFCDAAISDVYGLDRAQAAAGIARPDFLANVHPEDLPRLAEVMAGGLKKAGDLELEYRIRHPDGSVRWVLSRGHTYHDDLGNPVRRTGVGIETTRQRHLEEQLRQSQKMEAVGQLTGGLAHDFNNLLTGISGSIEMLQTRVAQGRLGDLDRYIVAAQGASKRAAALTHRLLAFSRRQTLDPKSTDVAKLVVEMADLIRRTVGPEITVETVNMVGLWNALVDPNQLENALLNLCINARDAMPDGGRLTIETSNRWVDDRTAKERNLEPGQYLSLCVSDTGTGMTPEVIARAFDPFFTTKPLGMGTGLGLSMIYGFAQQSGGQVRIYSEIDQGTTVCVYLPRHDGDGDVGAGEAITTDLPRAEQGETVLVVDDEPTVRMLVTDVLQDLGYRAIEAADGAAGLKHLQSDTRIDLLVTDVGLPGGMNGRQVADAAQTLRPDLKVLFITGYAENAVLSHGHLNRGMHVLTKPFDMASLATRIRDLIMG